MLLPRFLQRWLRPAQRSPRPARPRPLRLETLESRTLLTAFTPLQVRHAYGFDRVGFENASHALVAGDGRGTTIAIIDPGDDPNIASDLAFFDNTYGLAAPPSFRKVNQNGGTSLPPPVALGTADEIALDVEYAHAMAPGANILLVEANDPAGGLYVAVQYAAGQPGVVAVSMSYAGAEFPGEDSIYTHAGVTYLAGTGDYGAPPNSPSAASNVVAVGGTSLLLDGAGEYLSESGWPGSCGGVSRYENQPAYQIGVVPDSMSTDAQGIRRRTVPDVSFIADSVTIYDTYGAPGFYGIGGTSISCPIMAGLTAIVDQGRSYLFGRGSYSGTDFLNALYHLPQSDLNDITTGESTGTPHYLAGPGYDLVTGRGTPIVDRFVSGMIGAPVYNPLDNSLLMTGGARGSNDIITLSQSGSQLVIQVSAGIAVAGSGIPASQTFTFNSGQYSSVTVSTGDGATTVNVQNSTAVTVNLAAHGMTTVNVSTDHNAVNVWETAAGTATTVSGGSTMLVTVGRHGTVQNILGNVTLLNTPSYTAVVLDDSADAANDTVTLDTVVLGGATYSRIQGLAAAQVLCKCGDTSSILVRTGTGTEAVNVLATGVLALGGATTVEGHSPNTTVNVGSNNSLSGILGTLAVTNPPYHTQVNINDSADGGSHTNVMVTATSLTGLAPAAINLTGSSVSTFTLNGGSGNNTYTVTATPANTGMTLNTGPGADTVNIQNTSIPLFVDTPSGSSSSVATVTIGNAGRLAGIQGAVAVHNQAARDPLTIDDSNDSGNHPAVTISNTAVTGLAPAAINIFSASTLTLNGGSGNNAYTITATPVTTSMTLNTGPGADTVNVQGTSFPLLVDTPSGTLSSISTVTIGNAGRLAGIQAAVTVHNQPAYDPVTIDDSNDSGNHPAVTISSAGVTGLAPAAINFTNFSVSTLTIDGGSGNNAYTIAGTPADRNMMLNTGSGADAVNVWATSALLLVDTPSGSASSIATVTIGNAGNLAGILGAVTIHNQPVRDPVTIDDIHDSGAHASVTISNAGVTGLAPAPINFTNFSVSTLTLNGGSGNNTYTIAGIPANTGMTLNTGTGADVVNVQGTSFPLLVDTPGGSLSSISMVTIGNAGSLAGIQGAVTVHNQPARDPVTIDDSADSGNHSPVTISSAGVTGLAPAPINFSSSSVSTLTVNGGSGNNAYAITATPATTSMTLNTGLGGNSVNIQATSVPLTVNTGSGDTVTITSTSNTLDPIGAVTVNDPTGTSAVTVDDSGYAGNESYLVTSSTVTIGRSGTFSLTYGGIGALTLNGGPGSDVINIDSTSVATTVNAGGGGNIFRISPFTQYLAASILGPSLTLHGGGADILEFFDGSDPASETFNFDAVPMSLTLGSTGTDIANFSGMASVYLETNGASTVNDASGTVLVDVPPP